MSKIKVNEIEKASGSGITVPTGTSFTITDGLASASLPTVPVNKGGTNLTSFTAGDVLYATGSTTLAKLAKGTAGQYLKMNSGATAPEWATLSVSSDYVKLASVSSSAAELTIDGYFSSTYKHYYVLIDTYCGTSARNFGFRYRHSGSTDSGSNYTYASNYMYRNSGGGGVGADTTWQGTYIKISNGGGSDSKRSSGHIFLANPQEAVHKNITWNMTSWNDSNTHYNYVGGGTFLSSTACTGFALQFQSDGTNTARHIGLYGIK